MHSLIGAAGKWRGICRLREPSAPPRQWSSIASITPVIHKRFVRIDYPWWFDGAPQEGSLLCGYDAERRAAIAV
jgi:hypothetical protein